MSDVQLIAIHRVEDNIAGNYTVSDKIDPETGQHALVSVPRITMPGEWAAFPAHEAARLVRLGAARELTPEEIQLRQLTGLSPQ